MPAPYPHVTVVLIARERFSRTVRTIRSLYEHTTIPFTLVWVDVDYPERYRQEVEAALAVRDNVRIIRFDRYVNACTQRNAGARATTDPYLCLLENDNDLSPGWLEAMIDACERLDAGVCSPLLLEGWRPFPFIHHDPAVGHIRTWQENGITVRAFDPDHTIQERLQWTAPRIVDTSENHVLLFRRAAFERMGGFDERVFTRQLCDMCMALHAAGIRIALAPKAIVKHYAPPPFATDEFPYFKFIWNVRACERSEALIAEKWNIRQLPGSMDFVRGQHWRFHPIAYAAWWVVLHFIYVGRLMRRFVTSS